MMDAGTLLRFRKICGLLGSEHEGERAAAAVVATRFLKANGKTWADVGFSHVVLAQAYADAAMVDTFKKLLDSERARTTRMAEEITRLKRDVDRLKGMWPKGKPKRAA